LRTEAEDRYNRLKINL